MSKNIAFISKYGITPTYGNPTRQFYLSKYFVKKGFNVDLYTSQSSQIKKYEKFKKIYIKEKIDGVNHFLVKGPKINLGFSIKRIISWLIFEVNVLKIILRSKKEQNPDIIIVSSLSILTFITGIILKKKFKAKLIIEVRDIYPLTLIEVGGFKKFNPVILVLSIIEKLGYNNADYIVGTMPNLKEHVYNITNKNITTICIPQGFDHELEKDITFFSRVTLENIKKINKNKFNIIYSGTIGKANAIDVLIETAEKIYYKDKKIHFYIMGEGPLKEKYIDETKHLENLTFLPPIPSIEVYNFLKEFDLLTFMVHNSPVYRYGISFNKSIDYMRSGIPFIYTYEGFPSLKNEKEYCFKTNNKNDNFSKKIIEISKINKDELKKMGDKCIEVVYKNNTFDYLSEKYIELF